MRISAVTAIATAISQLSYRFQSQNQFGQMRADRRFRCRRARSGRWSGSSAAGGCERSTGSRLPRPLASSSLVRIRAVVPTAANRSAVCSSVRDAGHAAETRWTSSAAASVRNAFSSWILISSLGLRPAVSISTRSRSAMRPTASRISCGRGDDLHRQVDDVGVGPQLLDGGDAVGVDGDQADAAFLLQPVVGGQLGDGRGLAHAGRADQGHQRGAGRA